MIKLNNITKHFGDKKLFTNYNLEVMDQEKVLLAAPSGSGKTTLIRLLMGFELPDAGDVVIANESLDRHTVKKIRSAIAYVSQDTDLLDVTVLEQLETIFNYKINRHINDWQDKFRDLCPVYGLPETTLNETVNNLSGGERQRVALIIALLLERPIMILDEITSGLDSHLKAIIVKEVLSTDKTVIIVSHDDVWRNRDDVREVNLV